MNYQNIPINSKSNNSGNLRKIFIYNNTIISNIFSVAKLHEEILDKLSIDRILDFGMKSGNIIILENIMDLIKFYLNKNKDDLLDEINAKIFLLIEKCIKNKNSSVDLLNKIYQLISLLNKPNNIQLIEKIKLIHSMDKGLKKYSNNSEYIYSLLNCLDIIIVFKNK